MNTCTLYYIRNFGDFRVVTSLSKLAIRSGVCLIMLAVVACPAAVGQMHAVCTNCDGWYEISATGFGLNRNHRGLCGTCRNPDNFRDGERQGDEDDQSASSSTPGGSQPAGNSGNANASPSGGNPAGGAAASNSRDAAESINDALDFLNSGSTETGAGSGSNVPRNANDSSTQIANDFSDLLDFLNTGQKSDDLQGNNDGRYKNTKR